MKALSIRQPWAWLIVNGHKPIENRTWATNFRGELLIHAGLQYDKQGDAWVRANCPEVRLPDALDLGGIVGCATVSDCVDQHPSSWFFGPYGFVLAHARPLPFRALPGRLGFFDVVDDVVAGLFGHQVSQADIEAAGQERLFS